MVQKSQFSQVTLSFGLYIVPLYKGAIDFSEHLLSFESAVTKSNQQFPKVTKLLSQKTLIMLHNKQLIRDRTNFTKVAVHAVLEIAAACALP